MWLYRLYHLTITNHICLLMVSNRGIIVIKADDDEWQIQLLINHRWIMNRWWFTIKYRRVIDMDPPLNAIYLWLKHGRFCWDVHLHSSRYFFWRTCLVLMNQPIWLFVNGGVFNCSDVFSSLNLGYLHDELHTSPHVGDRCSSSRLHLWINMQILKLIAIFRYLNYVQPFTFLSCIAYLVVASCQPFTSFFLVNDTYQSMISINQWSMQGWHWWVVPIGQDLCKSPPLCVGCRQRTWSVSYSWVK